ncbi:MAG: DUF2279 domain-containing protein [Cyclobacteriaceae bacterium]
MRKLLFSLPVILCLACIAPAGAQSLRPTYPDTLHRARLTRAIAAQSAFYAAGLSYLHFIWYRDRERVPFNFYNDTDAYLQIDKFGHMYSAYAGSYISYHWLRRAGVKREKALLYGGPMGLIFTTPIEIFDGMYEGWGFSWPDMVANAAGSALVVGNELLFREQLIKYKFSFWRSPYARQANGYLGDSFLESLFLDYNGHTYWLSLPASSIMLKDQLPPWLNLAVGYSANGMFGEFDNRRSYRGVRLPETERYRQYLFSLDVDWTKIPTESDFLQGLFRALTFIKLPFPAVEINSRGQFRAYPVYF